MPYETGKYRFCLRLNSEKTGSRYVLSREVLWDLHIGHADTHDNVKEHDTQVWSAWGQEGQGASGVNSGQSGAGRGSPSPFVGVWWWKTLSCRAAVCTFQGACGPGAVHTHENSCSILKGINVR